MKRRTPPEICPRCEYAMTRENPPFYVCVRCERLFCGMGAGNWASSRLPGTDRGQHAPNRSGSRADEVSHG